MIEMNPFYAHESSVGPVFDVATEHGADPLSAAVQHRCGLKFENLTATQVEELRYFIQKNVSEISN